jgi:hypothetical protein
MRCSSFSPPISPLLFLAALLIGCGEAPRIGQAESDIVARTASDSAEVEPHQLTFPDELIEQSLLDRIDEGVEEVLLVGDRSSQSVSSSGHIDLDAGNPFGFMRRALSYQRDGDDIVIATEDVNLEEVVEELDANGQTFIGAPAGIEEHDDTEGARIIKLPPLDVSGVEIYRDGADYVRLPEARLELSLRVDTGANISWFRLEHAHLDIGADVKAKLAFEARLQASPIQLQLTTEIAKMHFALPSLGPIPQTLVLSLRAGCSHPAPGLVFSAGVDVQTGFNIGFTYDRGEGARPLGGAEFSASAMGPQVSVNALEHIEPKCFIEPRFELLFFDLVGPVAKTRLYGAVSHEASDVALYAGVEGRIGGTLRVLGWHVADLTAQVFDKRKEVWRGAL